MNSELSEHLTTDIIQTVSSAGNSKRLNWNSLSDESADVLVVRQLQRVHDEYTRPGKDEEHTVKKKKKKPTPDLRCVPGSVSLLTTHLFNTVSLCQPCWVHSCKTQTPDVDVLQKQANTTCWAELLYIYRRLLWSQTDGWISCSSLWSTWDKTTKHHHQLQMLNLTSLPFSSEETTATRGDDDEQLHWITTNCCWEDSKIKKHLLACSIKW